MACSSARVSGFDADLHAIREGYITMGQFVERDQPLVASVLPDKSYYYDGRRRCVTKSF